MTPKPQRRSTVGRPRALTDERIERILEWYRSRKTFKQVARENNVSVATVRTVIKNKDQYKQRAPEKRSSNLKERDSPA